MRLPLLAVFSLGLILAGEAQAQSPAIDRLIESLTSTQSITSDFSQTTASTSARVRTSSGVFWVAKPGLLRWEVRKPYAQLQLLDGREFWLYDPDLAQATVRPVSAANLTGIAALLLNSSTLSRQELSERYDFSDQGMREGLAWIEVIPKAPEQGVKKLLVAIDADAMMRRFEIHDAFGAITRVELTNTLKNTMINPALFRFTPPAGVSVLRAP